MEYILMNEEIPVSEIDKNNNGIVDNTDIPVASIDQDNNGMVDPIIGGSISKAFNNAGPHNIPEIQESVPEASSVSTGPGPMASLFQEITSSKTPFVGESTGKNATKLGRKSSISKQDSTGHYNKVKMDPSKIQNMFKQGKISPEDVLHKVYDAIEENYLKWPKEGNEFVKEKGTFEIRFDRENVLIRYGSHRPVPLEDLDPQLLPLLLEVVE